MRTIVVYEFGGKRYIALAGGASSFKTKEEILCTGTEKEIFSVSRPEHEPFLVLLKEAMVEFIIYLCHLFASLI